MGQIAKNPGLGLFADVPRSAISHHPSGLQPRGRSCYTHGTLDVGPQYVTGKVGEALDFDGIDDFVSTDKVASELGIDRYKPRNVSVWVYTRGDANGGIFDVGARVAAEAFCLRTLDDVVDQWRIQYWGGDQDFTFNTLEGWVHFTHVHDGTHMFALLCCHR